MDKKEARLKRASRLRRRVKTFADSAELVRLCVHKTPRNIYAQIINSEGKVLVACSTLDKEIKSKLKYSGNVASAKVIGEAIGKRAISSGVKNKVVFDCSGFKYHGRVKALADAARETGLEF
jgi:large subunit ribosomal protein L18